MKLSIKGANTTGLRLDLPIGSATLTIPLGATEGAHVEGELTGAAVELTSIVVARQTIDPCAFALPDAGTLELTKPLVASNVKITARVPLADPLSFTGRVEVGTAEIGGLRVNVLGVEAELAVIAKGVVIEQDAAHNRRLTVEQVDVSSLTARHALGKARVGRVILQALGVELTAAGTLGARISALAVSEATANGGDVDARVERVAIDRIELDASSARVGSLAVGAVSLAVSNLPIPDPFAPSPGPKATGPVKFEPPKLPDVPFLDDLQGRFNFDATVDIALPILKSRLATHKIRMDLVDGTFDFKRVEKGLSGLEDAVLDFEVKPGKLILEKDIPLIPFDNTTLVWWPLDPAEHENAKKNKRVRLRRMLDFTLTDFVTSKLEYALNAKGGSSFFKVALNRLNLDNLDCDVELGGPSRFELLPFVAVTFGQEGKKAVERVKVRGAIHFSPETDLDPTEVHVEVARALIGLERLSLLGYSARISEILVESIPDLKITFNEILPDTVEGTVNGVTLRDLEASGWALPALVF